MKIWQHNLTEEMDKLMYLKLSSNTEPPLSLHSAKVGSSVNYKQNKNKAQQLNK